MWVCLVQILPVLGVIQGGVVASLLEMFSSVVVRKADKAKRHGGDARKAQMFDLWGLSSVYSYAINFEPIL